MDLEQRERLRQQIADFRFSVVAELCNPYLSDTERRALITQKADMVYNIPGSKKTKISPETIRVWCIKYSRGGKEGLLPKQREDRGRPRSFSDSEAEAITALLEKRPELTAAAVIKLLTSEGVVTSNISSSAISRFVTANNLTGKQRRKTSEDRDRRRFAFEIPLECVQSDAMHGFAVPDRKGRKRKAILLAFIDDATRRVLYARFEFSEKSLLFEDGIKHILKAHGRIGRLYTDNGSTFVSNQTKRILDSLGLLMIHSRPYKPQGRGKVERFFRTVRQSFLRLLNEDEIKSLEHLNHLFTTWLETEYHRKIHSSLGITPMEAWLSKCDMVKRVDPFIDIDEAFLHRTTRKVYKDSIVSVNGTAFEVPPILIGKKVEIIYDPHPPLRKIFVRSDGKDFGEARPVDLYANTKVKRNGDFRCEIEPADNNIKSAAGGLL